MAVLAQPTALGDVDDIEKFVQATINRSRRIYPPDERDELFCEGLRISYDMWAKFDPRRDGYEQDGRFSGFLAKFLPLKLEDAYHRLHPEHTLRADPETGRRTYVYGERAASLDAMTAEDPDHQPLLADVEKLDPVTYARRAHKALWDRWSKRVKDWSEVAGLLAEGATDSDIAEIMGWTGEQVKEAKAAIAPEMPYILGGEQA